MFEPIKINADTNNLEVDFKKIHSESYINPKIKVEQQPVAISVGESLYKGNFYPIPFGSYGDFSCIVGASKSRKTFFKSMLIAGYIGGNSDNFAPSFKGHGTKDKYVLEFDTEQSRFHAKLCMDRVNEMVGSEYELYKTFALRQYNPNERLQFIDWIVNESEYRGKIGLISIDGYVDLVTDFNSLEQATNLSEKLMQWTSVGNLHCTGILHKNFGTSKPVGHVGSSVLKKAETVVFVEKDNDLTIVKCEYSRNIPFKTVAFKVNENWLPTEIDNYSEESYPVSKNSAFK